MSFFISLPVCTCDNEGLGTNRFSEVEERFNQGLVLPSEGELSKNCQCILWNKQ
jgi:hypothetical protein